MHGYMRCVDVLMVSQLTQTGLPGRVYRCLYATLYQYLYQYNSIVMPPTLLHCHGNTTIVVSVL